MWLFLVDNHCDNALDLTNGQLIIEYDFPYNKYCQWLISAQDDDGYVTLEFQHLNVKITYSFISFFKMM